MFKGYNIGEDNIKKIREAATRLNISEDEVWARIDNSTKDAAGFNPKILGGYVKRMTPDNSAKEVLAKQISDDLASHPERAPLIEKAMSNPALLTTINQKLGTNLTPQDLGYDPQTGSLNPGQLADTVLNQQKLPSQEGVAAAVNLVKEELGLSTSVSASAAASEGDAAAGAGSALLGQNPEKAPTAESDE